MSEIFFTLHATKLKEFCLTFQRFFLTIKNHKDMTAWFEF